LRGELSADEQERLCSDYRIVDGYVTGGDGQGFAAEGPWELVNGVGALAQDAAGNIYLAGTFSGRGRLGELEARSQEKLDAFAMKLSPTLEPQWTVAFASAGDEYFRAMAVTQTGRVLLLRSVGPSTAEVTTPSGAPQALVVSNLDSAATKVELLIALNAADGAVTWATALATQEVSTGGRTVIALDPEENAYVGSVVSGASNADSNVQISKVDKQGRVLAQVELGGPGQDVTPNLIFEPRSGRLVASFSTAGGFSLCGKTIEAGGCDDAVVISLHPDELTRCTVVTQLRDPGRDVISALVAAPSTEIYLIGYRAPESSRTDCSPLGVILGSQRMIVGKLSLQNGLEWLRADLGTNTHTGGVTGVARVGREGGIAVAGTMTGQTSVGGGPLPVDPPRDELASHAFVAEFNAQGQHERSFAIATTGSDFPFALGMDGEGRLLLGGVVHSRSELNVAATLKGTDKDLYNYAAMLRLVPQ